MPRKTLRVIAKICPHTSWKVYIAYNCDGHIKNEGLLNVTDSHERYKNGTYTIVLS